ncbi:MAG: hypothetical protein AB1403_26305, partial [Candidatus Riflebacteria bacterium]
ECVDHCGNGIIDADEGEECEENLLAGKNCTDFGYSSGFLACSSDCSYNFEGCFYPECGNGFVEDDEECDGVDLGDHSCTSLGKEAGTLRCNEDCTLNTEGCGFAFISLSAGYQHTCGITKNNSAWCWGINNKGQLGIGNTETKTSPTSVIGLEEDTLMISGGREHSCAIKTNGSLWCWGKNDFGQLGNGQLEDSLVPVSVTNMENGVTSVSIGADHTCALKTDGSVWCWGKNESGQLGNGTTEFSDTPIMVTELEYSVTALDSGFAHNCVQKMDGSAWCWGNNENGQIGDSTESVRLTPVWVENLGFDVSLVVTGTFHNFVIKNDRSVYAWGMGGFSQLGDDNSISHSSPVAISALENETLKLSAG